jgi:uncharacterized protein YndB with AHSA1/START domain
MSKNKLVVTLPSDTEILQVREFEAPRELIFKAYTDPEIVSQWWGPRKYEIIITEWDVRPGGKWRVVHRDQEGNEHPFRGEFREVSPPDKMVNTFEYEPLAGHISVEHTTFEDIGGRTRLTVLSRFANKEDRDGMIQSGMEEGAAESLERLDEALAEMQKENV